MWKRAAVAVLLVAGSCSQASQPAAIYEAAAATESASPLGDLLGFGADQSERNADLEELIAVCMGRSGFDYFPTQAPDELVGLVEGRPDLDRVRTSGYGIADGVEAHLAVLTGAVTDPNDSYRSSLSPAAYDRYRRAMSGLSVDEAEFDSNGKPVDPETGSELTDQQLRAGQADGCIAQALDAQTPDLTVTDPQLAGTLFSEAQALVSSNEQIVTLEQEWSVCMAENGFLVASQREIVGDLNRQADAIVQGAVESDLALETPDVAAQVDELREREIAIALVDFGCSTELFVQGPQIAREVELDYIRENESRIADAINETG